MGTMEEHCYLYMYITRGWVSQYRGRHFHSLYITCGKARQISLLLHSQVDIMSKPSSEELLRQNVFSSIHMSTEVKSDQVSIFYPTCSFCGGLERKSSGRKVATCFISLYTNSSDSFVVWSKKQDDPKGILWLQSLCIRRGVADADGGALPIELISKGCRGRCSHTLKFPRKSTAEEWYKCLKLESRKNSQAQSSGDCDPFSSGESGGEESHGPLDSILSETELDSTFNQTSIVSRKQSSSPIHQYFYNSDSSSSTSSSTGKKQKKSKKFRIPFTTSIMDRKVSLPVHTSTSYTQSAIETLGSPDSETLGRWSWPVKV